MVEAIKLLYFQSPACGVCHALRPKLEEFLKESYPDLSLAVVDIAKNKETAAQHLVFTTPVLIIQVDGREYERFVRAFSIGEVNAKLTRIVRAFS